MLNDTLISYAIFIFYLGERAIELLVNKINYQYLISQFFVVKRFPLESLQMKMFHVCWFIFLFCELNLHGKLMSGAALYFVSLILVFAQLLRWAAILSLGYFWSVDIYEMKNHPVVTTGPYKFFRHPNYLAVMTEFIFLPLLLGCPLTLVAGTIVNSLILHRRIKLEEEALEEQSENIYSSKFFVKDS